MAMMKKCPKCGVMLDSSTSFCTECGTNVSGVETREVTGQEAIVTPPVEPRQQTESVYVQQNVEASSEQSDAQGGQQMDMFQEKSAIAAANQSHHQNEAGPNHPITETPKTETPKTETPNTTANDKKPHVVIVQSLKSMGFGLFLTLIFGPLGMLYSSILGAVIMFVISAVIGFLTLGLGLIVVWPICLAWTYAAIKKHNKSLIAGKIDE
jgi:predicted  nucleic acid-binding Zn-ribbon protein